MQKSSTGTTLRTCLVGCSFGSVASGERTVTRNPKWSKRAAMVLPCLVAAGVLGIHCASKRSTMMTTARVIT